MNLKDQFGKLLFFVISIGLLCAQCMKDGLICTHELDKNPHWKPAHLMAKVDAIMYVIMLCISQMRLPCRRQQLSLNDKCCVCV